MKKIFILSALLFLGLIVFTVSASAQSAETGASARPIGKVTVVKVYACPKATIVPASKEAPARKSFVSGNIHQTRLKAVQRFKK